VRAHRSVLLLGLIALCAWCGWISGYHRTTGAAEITWIVSVIAVVLTDVALWLGRTGGRVGWRLEPVGDPWPRRGHGGAGPALRGVAPWLALLAVVTAWEVLGIDTGPHRYHLTISALAQAYRPLNAALLLFWMLVGIGYEVARVRAPETGGETATSMSDPNASENGTAGFGAAVGAMGGHYGGPALLLPSSPPIGVAFWVAVPLVAIVIDVVARHSRGRTANAEEFVRFVSTSRLANIALVAAWVFAGYHLFAR
jgi:hypothetical protein